MIRKNKMVENCNLFDWIGDHSIVFGILTYIIIFILRKKKTIKTTSEVTKKPLKLPENY